MTAVVVDASAIVDILLVRKAAHAVSTRIFREADELHAPYVLDAEVVHTLRKYWINGEMSSERGAHAIGILCDLPITRHAQEDYLRRMWELRENITAYDAAYVALAEALNLPLITRDTRLARSSGHAARIEYID